MSSLFPGHTHYETLEVSPTATSDEIKQAFRRLAKIFHPDRKTATASLQKFQALSVAYEVLTDDRQRKTYDHQLRYGPTAAPTPDRSDREAKAHRAYRTKRQAQPESEDLLETWMNRVYTPVNRVLNAIIKPLRSQIKALSADPFDDELMDVFQAYIDECCALLDKAQTTARSLPNPPIAAATSANLYYCMSQLGDALSELNFFAQSYEETYLHDGIEMFRIAEGLRKEAATAARHLKD